MTCKKEFMSAEMGSRGAFAGTSSSRIIPIQVFVIRTFMRKIFPEISIPLPRMALIAKPKKYRSQSTNNRFCFLAFDVPQKLNGF